jgi:prepilin-type N-terminal cleavage/methylation domain-containing protein/prepilin-type processing-associated H-X9-DG protein
MSRRFAPRIVRRAFTLVELLVVVGIITILIALLLPALSGAREHANRIKCLATLRSMGQAAQIHAQEHRGYMPLAGIQPMGAWPEAVGDATMKKYTYYSIDRPREGRPPYLAAPLSVSLGQYMGLPLALGSGGALQDSLRSELVYRHFTCPSDPEPPTGSTIVGYTAPGPDERMSYLYNMPLLGLTPTGMGLPGLGGNVAQVRRPSEVFLFADGQGGVPPPTRSLPNFGVRDGETLYDYWRVLGKLGSPFPNLDLQRHRRRINVVFVDGHGETVTLPDYRGQNLDDLSDKGGITRVGVSMGIYK